VDAGYDVACDFVGTVVAWDKGSLPEMKALTRDLGLEDRVRFLEDRTDIPNLLHEADIFALTSRFEGFGLVVVEAMAAGLPVVASNLDGPAEIIEHGVNGLLFESESDADLAAKLRTLIEDEEFSSRIARAGGERAHTFDIGTMRNKYYEMYQTMVGAR
jgi:glycosyltransferase involved in cell wall biosynthesis